MRPPPFRLVPRPDETLYSVMARWGRYLGDPPRAHLERVVFGTKLKLYHDLPVGLGRLSSGGWLDRDVDAAIGDLTLFRYYAAGVGGARRAAGRAAMLGDGPWPHGALGSWRPKALPAERLRFCPACFDEMLATDPDPWWRRIHQLPTVLLCPEHGHVLRESTVSRRRAGAVYVSSSRDVCLADAAPAVPSVTDAVAAQLFWLARRSQDLLDAEGEASEDDRPVHSDRMGKGDVAGWKVPDRSAVIEHWRPVLDLRPDWCAPLAGPRWLAAALNRGEGPPLHRMLVEGYLECC